jgi:hypothetical protein
MTDGPRFLIAEPAGHEVWWFAPEGAAGDSKTLESGPASVALGVSVHAGELVCLVRGPQRRPALRETAGALERGRQ